MSDAAAESSKRSYSAILKASVIVGGSSVIGIMIGMVRTKVLAVLLGPGGFGLFGLYGSVLDLAVSVAGAGVNSSGVRQLASASATGEEARISAATRALKSLSWVLGVIGSLLLFVLAGAVSNITFGTDQHSLGIRILSIAVLIRCVSAAQAALLQGFRRIADFARINVISAVLGTIVTIPIVYLMRDNGVVPALVATAFVTLLSSWYFSRTLPITNSGAGALNVKTEMLQMLRLGAAFMATGLLMLATGYIIRVLVLRKCGMDGAGLYHAAWTLGGLFVGIVLQAMGADFYPRLSTVAHDDAICNQVVNEQARVSLLLAGPGVLGTITLAALVVPIFYSSNFSQATGLLQWVCLGMMLKVITWPMGFIILAKGRQKPFFWSELVWAAVHVGSAWLFLEVVGLNGAGIGFFISYLVHWMVIAYIVKRLTGFSWSTENRRTIIAYLSSVVLLLAVFHVAPSGIALPVGVAVLCFALLSSYRELSRLVDFSKLPFGLGKFFQTRLAAR